MQSATRTVPAFVVALLAGVVQALQMYAPRVAASGGMDVRQLGVLLPLLGVVSLLVSPIGAAIAGYVWGTAADVSAEWLRFTVAVILAALGGFAAMSVVLLGLLLGAGTSRVGAVLAQAAYSLISGLGLVSVGLIVLAGGAIAEFRSH